LAAGKKLIIGSDVNLYRSAADTLKTDDSLVVAGAFSATGDLAYTSWTPAITGSGSVVFSTVDGWYYRLGDLVIFNAYFTVSTAGSGSTKLSMNLPVTPYRGSANRRQLYTGAISDAIGTGGVVGSLACWTFASGSSGVDRFTMANGPDLAGSHLIANTILSVQGIVREA
jgi:hypothetical protein